MEIKFEKYSVSALSLLVAIIWLVYGKSWTSLIKADNSIIYQTMLMFSTIVVAIMTTIKAILLTAEGNNGIRLLKTNAALFERFISYIFWCIMWNLFFCGLCFFLMVLKYDFDTSPGTLILVFSGSFSFLSLVRALVLFRIIVTTRV
jgi:hypothetical protein